MSEHAQKLVQDALLVTRIARAILETVQEAGAQGAPCGHLYLALSQRGYSLDFWNEIERLLLDSKLVRKRAHCLYAV